MDTEDIEIKNISKKLLMEILFENEIETISDIKNISSNLRKKNLEIREHKELANKKIENLRSTVSEKDRQIKEKDIKLNEKDEQIKEKDNIINYLMIQGRDWVNRCLKFEEDNKLLTNGEKDKGDNDPNKRQRMLE